MARHAHTCHKPSGFAAGASRPSLGLKDTPVSWSVFPSPTASHPWVGECITACAGRFCYQAPLARTPSARAASGSLPIIQVLFQVYIPLSTFPILLSLSLFSALPACQNQLARSSLGQTPAGPIMDTFCRFPLILSLLICPHSAPARRLPSPPVGPVGSTPKRTMRQPVFKVFMNQKVGREHPQKGS